ncbi:MAG TPA: PAS domain S-box protein, partial [Terriglobales bacterium]|nr:PAS domain S-box protein [Terriglobales bacterium]
MPGHEINTKKMSEIEIDRLNQLFENIIDNVNVWLSALDQKGSVFIWNKAGEQISGYSREEVIGHNKIWEWIYPDKQYRECIRATADRI